MSIKSNAEIIRDETATNANTAARVGGNLVEIANDLIAKQTEIDLNTAKISFDNEASTRLANTSGTNTGDVDNTITADSDAPTIILKLWAGSQVEYNAIVTKVATTIYNIV